MRKVRLMAPVGLAALAVLLLLGVGRGSQRPASATNDRPAWQMRVLTPTLYLPVVQREYDAEYVSPFGVAMYDNVTDTEALQIMEDAGAQWVVTMLYWSRVEPKRDVYDWSSFDAKVQDARAAGMQVFALFVSNPSWAAVLPAGPVTDTQDLVQVASQMAERYDCDGVDDAPGSLCVDYWSFYSEPDNGSLEYAQQGWGYWGHDGDDYAGMLAQVSPAIHAANPRAKVLIGGIAYDRFEGEDPDGIFVRSFLTQTLATLQTYPGGARAYIDAVAFHYYANNLTRWPTIVEKAADVQGIMDRHGAGDLPLICPETGYGSGQAGSSELIQAQWLVRTFVRGVSARIKHLSWLRVFDVGNQYPDETAGLYRVDRVTPKPAYYAYSTMTGELARARYLRPLAAAGAEGYVFRMPNGREKTVLWATSTTTNVVFPYSCLRRVDAVSAVSVTINDNDSIWDQDHAANGQITLRVEQDAPLYVGPCG